MNKLTVFVSSVYLFYVSFAGLGLDLCVQRVGLGLDTAGIGIARWIVVFIDSEMVICTGVEVTCLLMGVGLWMKKVRSPVNE